MDCSQLGSSVYGILQARILEWVAISFSRRSSQLRDRTRIFCISCTGRQILFHWATSSSHRTIIDHSYVECGLNCFICFNSAYSHSKPLKQTLLLIPFLRWGKWGLECCLVQGYRVIRRQSQRCKRTSTNARQAVAETAGYTCVECTAGWEGRSHLVKYPGRLQGRGGGSMRLGKVRGISSGGDQGLEKGGNSLEGDTHWGEHSGRELPPATEDVSQCSGLELCTIRRYGTKQGSPGPKKWVSFKMFIHLFVCALS